MWSHPTADARDFLFLSSRGSTLQREGEEGEGEVSSGFRICFSSR